MPDPRSFTAATLSNAGADIAFLGTGRPTNERLEQPHRREDRRLPGPRSAGCLRGVPAPLVLCAIAGAAQAAAACRAALYVVDIDGTALRLAAGDDLWPAEMAVSGALGPELPATGLGDVEIDVRRRVAGACLVPVCSGDRVIGALVTSRPPRRAIATIAQEAAGALQIADRVTDVAHTARRRRKTTAAVELQQDLLPPRLASLRGASVAAAIVPVYDFGGDWFDYADNPDGVWIAVADAVGSGTSAAGPSMLALGALRAARRAGATIEQAGLLIDATIKELDDAGAFVTAILGHWESGSRTLRWLRFGHPLPLLVDRDGTVVELDEPGYVPLGLLGDEALRPSSTQLGSRQQVILTSDGVWERETRTGTRLELAGIRTALANTIDDTAAGTVTTLTRCVIEAHVDPPHDDATVLVLAPSEPPLDSCHG
jgi:serine phosphatase RsbU (regulator of sigma subunit)